MEKRSRLVGEVLELLRTTGTTAVHTHAWLQAGIMWITPKLRDLNSCLPQLRQRLHQLKQHKEEEQHVWMTMQASRRTGVYKIVQLWLNSVPIKPTGRRYR